MCAYACTARWCCLGQSAVTERQGTTDCWICCWGEAFLLPQGSWLPSLLSYQQRALCIWQNRYVIPTLQTRIRIFSGHIRNKSQLRMDISDVVGITHSSLSSVFSSSAFVPVCPKAYLTSTCKIQSQLGMVVHPTISVF